ncbi:hypothetical protein COLO4_05670 [Corchorus olitorius]|uniref:Uncharacterized protein n=1 Tax=Corchorus olitorius TaxID=93759 RepID=A0A1R3KQC0_9ROSI|nr:hypothetical protein COLO4_05670 [Corchorus olitorius]
MAREAEDPKQIGSSSTSVAALSMQQLQEMIASTIKAQYGVSSKSYHAYSKPYTRRIDDLRLPSNYNPPKFQQFDGKRNPQLDDNITNFPSQLPQDQEKGEFVEWTDDDLEALKESEESEGLHNNNNALHEDNNNTDNNNALFEHNNNAQILHLQPGLPF